MNLCDVLPVSLKHCAAAAFSEIVNYIFLQIFMFFHPKA